MDLRSGWWSLALLVGCARAGSAQLGTGDPGSDADTDVDADTDSDTDADTDADTDTDVTDTGDSTVPSPPRIFDAAHVLVIPTNDGIALMANDGTIVHGWSWNAMVGDCGGCTGEGSSADDVGLLVSWAGMGQNQGIARIDETGAVDFVVTGMQFPHEAIRDPADQSILVPEAFSNNVNWYAGDGSSDAPVRTLNGAHPDWSQNLPNGAERVDYDGRAYLLLSNRGSGAPNFGRITFWDITDPSAIEFVWSYPRSGTLDTPHGPVFRQFDGQWYLLYAHSYGAPDGGAVGVAVTSDPTLLPDYVADLVPEAPVGPFDFLRGVELTEDGWLWMTDSGPEFGFGEGRVMSALFPTGLVPDGSVGNEDDQTFVPLPNVTVVLGGLDNPFEGWLWLPTIVY